MRSATVELATVATAMGKVCDAAAEFVQMVKVKYDGILDEGEALELLAAIDRLEGLLPRDRGEVT